MKRLLVAMMTTFGVTFVAAALVTLAWNAVGGAAAVDWDTALHLGLILGIAIPLSSALAERRAG